MAGPFHCFFFFFFSHFWLCCWWRQCQVSAWGCGGRAGSETELCAAFLFPLCLLCSSLPICSDDWCSFSVRLVPTIFLPPQPPRPQTLCLEIQLAWLPTSICTYKVQWKRGHVINMAHAKSWHLLIKTTALSFPTLSPLARGYKWHVTIYSWVECTSEEEGLKDLMHCMHVRAPPSPRTPWACC